MTSQVAIPRNTTRQAEGLRVGQVARMLHRIAGTVVVAFVLVHVVVQAIRHVPPFAGARAAMPWLEPLQHLTLVHAVLFACVTFHTLHGLKLFAGDLGVRVPYRAALWVIVALSVVAAALAWVPRG
jgi:succinate dehydrogenase/fumarate reductase cytochrome b subunit